MNDGFYWEVVFVCQKNTKLKLIYPLGVFMKMLPKIALAGSLLVASQFASARDWTCHATIFLTGSSQSFTLPGWKQSGNIFVDREKKCKEAIDKYALNSAIYDRFSFSPAQEVSLCKTGGATFRVEYGFDKRPKSWQFSKRVAPSCNVVCDVKGFN